MTAFVTDRTGLDGRIGQNFMPTLLKWVGVYSEPWVRALRGSEFASCNREDLVDTFK